MNRGAVLYVEDEENDVFFMQRAWKKAGIVNPLKVVTDGAQAIQYLAGEGKFSDREHYHAITCPAGFEAAQGIGLQRPQVDSEQSGHSHAVSRGAHIVE